VLHQNAVDTSTEQFGGTDDVGEQHRLEHSFIDGKPPTGDPVDQRRRPKYF
jgi:hypothetical protein